MTINDIKNTRRIQAKHLLAITASIFAVGLISFTIQNVYAVNCCYATHNMQRLNPPYGYAGVQAFYPVYEKNVPTGSTTAPTWITLALNTYREVGWKDNSGTAHVHTYCAINGSEQPGGYYGVINGTSYTFTVSNTNLDFTWDMITVGIACSTTGPSIYGNPIQVGYEPSSTQIQLQKLNVKNQKFYLSSWQLWDSAQGTLSKTITPQNPVIYYVLLCGSTPEQYYHSQHGSLPQPATCT